MALTEVVMQRLEAKGFSNLFESDVSLWEGMAERARKLMATQIPDGRQPTIDDIRKLLLPLVEVAPKLRDHLGNKRLTQKYWIGDFTDYILHRVYQPKLQIPKPEGS